MVKIVVVEALGILIGEVAQEEGYVIIARPLAFAPSQGGMALQENPLYGANLKINANYVIAQSDPNDTMREQYEAYAIKKRSGIVTPGDPEMQRSKLKL